MVNGTVDGTIVSVEQTLNGVNHAFTVYGRVRACVQTYRRYGTLSWSRRTRGAALVLVPRPIPRGSDRRAHLPNFYHDTETTLMLRGSTGVVLALASSLVKATTSYSSRRAHTILRNGSTSAYSASASEYEPLKKSRSFRIRARLLPTNERADDFVGPAETTKIVHFQRHAQGTQLLEFGRSAFFYLPRPSFSLTRKSSYHSLVWVGMHNAIYKEWTDETGTPLDLSETDPMKNPLLLPRVIDSPLTPKGKDQCAEQRPAARALEGVELIVISPLVRCLQTAHM